MRAEGRVTAGDPLPRRTLGHRAVVETVERHRDEIPDAKRRQHAIGRDCVVAEGRGRRGGGENRSDREKKTAHPVSDP